MGSRDIPAFVEKKELRLNEKSTDANWVQVPINPFLLFLSSSSTNHHETYRGDAAFHQYCTICWKQAMGSSVGLPKAASQFALIRRKLGGESVHTFGQPG